MAVRTTTRRVSRSGSVSAFATKMFNWILLVLALDVYKEQTMPVIEHYSKEGKVATVRLLYLLLHTSP